MAGTPRHSKNKITPPQKDVRNLVVVESPAKAKTIGRILGKNYNIAASLGHVRDLPKGKLGIDVEDKFTPSYSVMRSRSQTLKELKKLGKNAPLIYLATDPDREGEAISWHLADAAGWSQESKTLKRVVFHEITESAIKEAFNKPRELDQNLINAQQARRLLDRLVGYELSPLLWRKVQRGLSAGRVQSVALKIVVEREREIEAFTANEYWTIVATLTRDSTIFPAMLHSLKGKKGKLGISNEAEAEAIRSDLLGSIFKVETAKTIDKRRRPAPPFTTSTLQQEAWRKLRFSARKTMMVAQQLYEGLVVGTEGAIGLITYMRTDSTTVSTAAIAETRQYIADNYGPEYAPKDARIFKTKSRAAQEAHEGIRPTSVQRVPRNLSNSLNRDQLKLYELIWKRMVASQMADAIFEATTVDIHANSMRSQSIYIFRATGSRPKFLGFVTLYVEDKDDTDEQHEPSLPLMKPGHVLECNSLEAKQHFTQPPSRYTEASLVKLLEERGIGRPSTYAPIMSTLVDRNYVIKDDGRLKPTILGIHVSDLLTQFFPDVMNVSFTVNMENELDDIATGQREWIPMLERFYFPFKETVNVAQEKMPRIKVEEPTDQICDLCNSPMVIKTGRFGRFVSCSTFPECRNTKPILKHTGVTCPQCGGNLVERRSKGKGRLFYGCAKFPACTFRVTQRPLQDPCPECSGLMVAQGRNHAACTTCAWKGDHVSSVSSAKEG